MCGSKLPDCELSPGSLVLKKYEIINNISTTSFSRVYLAIEIKKPIYVATKELKLEPSATPKQNAADITQFKLEISFIKRINSIYVVKLLDSGVENGKCYMVTEFILGPTLKALKEIKGSLDEITVIRFAKDIFLGVKDMHAAGILSRDIKPLNLILNSHLIHIDLGIGKKIGQHTNRSIKNCFTSFFAAPEQRTGIGSFETSDIYSSCATMLWLMAPPNLNEIQLDNILHTMQGPKIEPGEIQNLCPKISRKFAGFIAKGMHIDHRRRWDSAKTAYEALCGI